MNNLFPRSHFRPGVDYGKLWEDLKAQQARERIRRAWIAEFLGTGRQAVNVERVNEYEEQQLLKHEL